jgi:tetratricopeptide (TPR) repeat protein
VALREAVALEPDIAHNRFNLANLLEIHGLYDEAESHFAAYVAAAPDDPLGRLNYALHLQKQGRLTAALDQAGAALRLDDDLLLAAVVRGQLLEALGRYDEAIAVVAQLEARDQEQSAKLADWRARLESQRDEIAAARASGAVHLLHIVAADREAVVQIETELAAGVDFFQVAMRHSVGPAAVRGGDIGWVVPATMVEPMRSAIARLGPGEVSPAVEARGQFHLFKRLQ